jgi:hypothetical protein
MIVKELQGKNGQLRYHLFNDDDSFVAWFDSLWDAAAVARYITGAEMSEGERAQAVAAMKNAQVALQMGVTLNQAKAAKAKKRAAAQGDKA